MFQVVTFLSCLFADFSHHAGIPHLADHAQLELAVTFNACVGSFAHSQFSEAELCLKHAVQRGRKSSAVFKAFLSFALDVVPHLFSSLCLQSCKMQPKNRLIQKTPLCFGEQPSSQWKTRLSSIQYSVCLVCSGQCGWPVAR